MSLAARLFLKYVFYIFLAVTTKFRNWIGQANTKSQIEWIYCLIFFLLYYIFLNWFGVIWSSCAGFSEKTKLVLTLYRISVFKMTLQKNEQFMRNKSHYLYRKLHCYISRSVLSIYYFVLCAHMDNKTSMYKLLDH